MVVKLVMAHCVYQVTRKEKGCIAIETKLEGTKSKHLRKGIDKDTYGTRHDLPILYYLVDKREKKMDKKERK